MYNQQERFALLRKWKEESELTFDAIAATTDIPKSTVQRIIEGRTQSPAFESVAPIVITLGHTLDEYYGLEKEGKEMTMVSLLKSSMEQQLREKDIILDLRLKEKDAIIEGLKQQIAEVKENKNRSVHFLRRLIMILASAIGVAVLIGAGFVLVYLYTISP